MKEIFNTVKVCSSLLFYIYCFVLIMPLNKAYGQNTNEKPLSIGKTVQLPSMILQEIRIINIYLPEGYKPADSLAYPVVYILDGGLQEDFIHITGIIQFSSQTWVKRLPKSIVVGIENTNRKRDFTFQVSNLDFIEKAGYKKEDMPHYGGPANYIAFLEKELQPFIESKFKTTNHRTIIGESLAGLLVTEVLLNHTQLFNNYIIISPSLWWGGDTLLKHPISLEKDGDRNRLKVYIGVPYKREDEQMYKSAKRLHKLLLYQNYNCVFDYMPRESHATVIHQAVYNAIGLFNFGKGKEL